MKIRQTVRHFAAKQALQLPGIRTAARRGLVTLHTRVFIDRADPEHAEERRDHLAALFDATTDMYLAALQDGYDEATAREITHIVANFDFYNHAWTEMMEFPGDELDTHYQRYQEFFDTYNIAIDDPLGDFQPPTGLPEAPKTPEKLDDPDYAHADAGYADDVYVEDETGTVSTDSRDEPDDVSPSDAPGVDS